MVGNCVSMGNEMNSVFSSQLYNNIMDGGLYGTKHTISYYVIIEYAMGYDNGSKSSLF